MRELPYELLENCLSWLGVGRSHYNDRERQHDLTLAARVSRSWNAPATALLYASPACANTGRASLLEDIVTKRSDYSMMATRFAWTAKNGLVDGALLNSLLSKLPNVERVEIGSQLLQSPFIVTQLSTTLSALPLRSFTCASSWVSPLAHVVPLLGSMPHLRHLDLFNFFDIYASGPDFLEHGDGARPTYDLDTLSIRSIDQLSPARLAWLLGDTRDLKKLCLGISTELPKAASEEMLELLRPFALCSLEISVDGKMSKDAEGRHGIALADLAIPVMSQLSSLTLGGHQAADIACLATLRHEQLRSLTLLDTWLASDIGRLIFEDRLPSLKELCVVNLSRNDVKARDLRWICESRDVALALEKRFH